MALATFTNEQLVVSWATQSQLGGTRGDVVKDLMEQMGADPANPDAFRKAYNNVTQRFKQLKGHNTHPIDFPQLEQGQKGARRSAGQMEALQNLMNETAAAVTDPEPEPPVE